MKKTFELTHPKIKIPRMLDAIKFEIKKYVKRERRKALPEEATHWDFDCRFGVTEDEASEVQLSQLNKKMDEATAIGCTSFYVEILAKPVTRD
ncbi:DUF6172 family protein [Aliiglaciecola litoralis]|uniref:Uncharacterized protein n=1 Tax=Aliiglaciecola litoralis TaxID=582857 RepID=A0ABN1LCN6_9ALTE